LPPALGGLSTRFRSSRGGLPPATVAKQGSGLRYAGSYLGTLTGLRWQPKATEMRPLVVALMFSQLLGT
jgi:hypothetical protein